MLSLVKIGPVVLERRFLNFVNVFSLFRNYLPFEKRVSFIWRNLNPHIPRMLCAKFGWNWPSDSGKEDENVKSLQTRTYGQTDGRKTDNRRSEKLTWAFSSDELKTMYYISKNCFKSVHPWLTSLHYSLYPWTFQR